jgi:ABC-2 type transport system ATP-binding protein
MQRRFIELINEERGRGKTVLMSSHQFDEVDRTCQRAVIIRQGHIVATEEIASLKASLRRSYIVTVGSTSDVETIKASGIAHRILSATTVEIFVGSDYARMLSTLATCQVTGLESTSQSLEQVFIQYYGQEVQ